MITTVAVGAVLMATGLAACGSTDASHPSDVRSRPMSLLKPGENPADQRLTGKRRGGTLTVYTAAGFEELDPGESYYTIDYAIDYATQRPLFSYAPNNASTLDPGHGGSRPHDLQRRDQRRREDRHGAYPHERALQPPFADDARTAYVSGWSGISVVPLMGAR